MRGKLLPLKDIRYLASADLRVFVCSQIMFSTYKILTSRRTRRQEPQKARRQYSRYAAAIVEFFGRHRIVLATHVQRQFADVLHSDRMTRLHLQTLVGYGDIMLFREQVRGRPNVYLISQQSFQRLSEANHSSGEQYPLVRLHSPTGSHLAHELLITEIAVSIAEAVRLRPDLNLPWEERFGLVAHTAFRYLVPDYTFLLQRGKDLLLCLVEASVGEESPTRIGQKLQKYLEWGNSPEAQKFMVELYRAHGASTPRPQFRLLFVAQNRRFGNDWTRLNQVFNEALRLPQVMRQRIWATTVTALADASGIDAPIWVRGADLTTAESQWSVLPRCKRPRFLASVLRSLQRHKLFPLPKETENVPSHKD